MILAKGKILKTVVVLSSLWLAGLAAADIPAYVDFWAEQTAQYHPLGNPNPWTIHKNLYGYVAPVWNAVQPYSELTIDNQYVSTNYKELWLEIHLDEVLAEVPFDVEVTADTTQGPVSITAAPVDFSTDLVGGTTTITWMWTLNPQPGWEKLAFVGENIVDDVSYLYDLNVGQFFYDMAKGPHITSIEVGTFCVPVPGSLLLCGVGLGFIGTVRRFRRPRQTALSRKKTLG